MSKGFRVSRQIGRDKYNSFVTRYESFVKPSTWTQLTGANGASNRVSAPPRLNIFSIESIVVSHCRWGMDVFERSLDEAISTRLTLAETVIIWPCPMKGNGGNFSSTAPRIRRKSWGWKLRIILEKYGGRRVGTVVDGSTNTRFVAYTCTWGV